MKHYPTNTTHARARIGSFSSADLGSTLFVLAAFFSTFLALGSLGPATAWAQADRRAEAKRHYDRALELADEGAYTEAVVEFNRAYEISPHHTVLYNLGQAYVALGNPVKAVEALRRHLAEGQNRISAARRAQVEQEIRRQEARIATLTIETSVAGASIRLDGVAIGKTPLAGPVRVGLGEHYVAAALDGHRGTEQIVTVAGEEKRTVNLKLDKLQAGTPAATGGGLGSVRIICAEPGIVVEVDGTAQGRSPLPGPFSVTPGPHVIGLVAAHGGRSAWRVEVTAGSTVDVPCELSSPPTGVQLAATAADTTTDPGHTRRVWGYVAGGLGLAMGVASLSHFLWNKGRFDDWEAEDARLVKDRMAGVPNLTERQQANNALAESIGNASPITISLGVGAGALVATGIILVATAPSSGAATAPPDVAPPGAAPPGGVPPGTAPPATPPPAAPPTPTHAFGVGPGFVTWRVVW